MTDWLLLYRANIEVESAYRQEAISTAGAIGLGQLMPETAEELGVDPTDPFENLDGSARYLALMLREFGNPQLALEIVQCQRLVKGYGDTHARGLSNYQRLMQAVQRAGSHLAPATLRELREAALADEHGKALQAALARHALA